MLNVNEATRRAGNASNNFRRHLALSTALASFAIFGYGGRAAYAGNCGLIGPGTYECSGAAGTDLPQTLGGTPLEVTTTSGFGIDTSASFGNALTLIGTGGLIFTDDFYSAITGQTIGIDARNGSGGLSITTTGAVTRSGSGLDNPYDRFGRDNAGISAISYNRGSATISAATVSGATGIYANANDVSITTTGTVTGTERSGIVGFSGFGGVSISAAGTATSGRYDGIFALVIGGYGALSVSASGTVTGTDGSGISARSFLTRSFYDASDASMLITQAAGSTTQGGIHGIKAENGAGPLTINARGTSIGGSGDGIHAVNRIGYPIYDGRNYGKATSLAITANNAHGQAEYGSSGIYARNYGTGALSVTATGMVTGTGEGILAINESAGTDLTVTVTASAAVSGGIHGSEARSLGAGALNVTTAGTVTTGPVTGNTRHGIYARSFGTGTLNVTTTGTVTGNDSGIEAINFGGTSVVNASGTVTGGRSGIYAGNFGTDMAVTVTGAVSGNNGIFARNGGTGTLNVTTTGTVTGTDYGIRVDNLFFSSGAVNVNAGGTVTGGRSGIYASSYATEPLSVTVTGTVIGGTGSGIHISNDKRSCTTCIVAPTVITLNSGAAVSATSGTAISNDAGDSATTVNTGAAVTGSIRLGDGSDDLTFDSGDFSAVTEFDGGANTGAGASDALTFRNVSGSLDGSTAINWENVVIGDGGSISLGNTLVANAVNVEGGGALGGTGTVQGNLVVADGGSVGPGNSAGDLTIDGDFTLASGADVFLEVEGTSIGEFDRLLISGDLMLEGDVTFQAATGITDDLFESAFDIFDFIVDIDLTPGPELAFDITFFQDANYFFQSAGSTFGATLFSDGTFSISDIPLPQSVPEPGTLALFGGGLLGLFGLGRSRRRKQALAA